MNINLTLIVQMVVFVVLIWFTMKFVWPMILGRDGRALDEDRAGPRRGREGPAGAGAGAARTRMRSSAKRASAPRRSSIRRSIAPTSSSSRRRGTATQEGQRLVAAAQQQIELEANRARESLRKEVAQLAVSAASKLLEREIDPRAHADLISKLATQI